MYCQTLECRGYSVSCIRRPALIKVAVVGDVVHLEGARRCRHLGAIQRAPCSYSSTTRDIAISDDRTDGRTGV